MGPQPLIRIPGIQRLWWAWLRQQIKLLPMNAGMARIVTKCVEPLPASTERSWITGPD